MLSWVISAAVQDSPESSWTVHLHVYIFFLKKKQ